MTDEEIPHDQLIAELLDSRIPKTDREHAAAREIKRLLEALAEPEQEPTTDGELYAAFLMGLQSKKPAKKPLTYEEVSAIVQSISAYTWDAHMLARAVERAHGIDGGHECWR